MNLIYQWCQNNLDIIFFIYGLAFVTMGIAILTQPKRVSEFKIAGILWLLAGFGLTHGANEWLDMWAIIKGQNPTLDIIRWFTLLISYIFLFEFGRQLFRISRSKYSILVEKTAGVFVGCVAPIIMSVILIFSFISTDFWRIGTIWVRYLLGLPSGFLISFGLFLYYSSERKILELFKGKKYFLFLGLSSLAYSILGGLIVPKANFFPANLFNTDTFLSIVKVPVQAFRTICAIIIAWAVYKILRVFNSFLINKLQGEIAERKQVEEKLQAAYTELKKIQAQLIQSEKLAAIGELVAGISHEIANPLNVISGRSKLILMEEVLSKDTEESAKIIKTQSEKISQIIDRLSKFARRTEPKQERLNINNLIEETLPILEYQIRLENIKIIKDYAQGLPDVSGDKNQLQEVFLNILLNAAQAMPNGGNITIKTSLEKITEYGIRNGRRKTDIFKIGDEVVVIEFMDTGLGIPKENLDKIFDPFFTTKSQGTGLGLSVSYGIIEAHRGGINVQSNVGGGTTFIVRLPKALIG